MTTQATKSGADYAREGFLQVSRAYRQVARLDPEISLQEAYEKAASYFISKHLRMLVEQNPDGAGKHPYMSRKRYLREYAKLASLPGEWACLTAEQFAEFHAAKGGIA